MDTTTTNPYVYVVGDEPTQEVEDEVSQHFVFWYLHVVSFCELIYLLGGSVACSRSEKLSCM